MNEFREVGERIAQLRGDLTKQDFAARLGVDRKTVERWEAGERIPDGSKLLRLMVEFGADVNYILTGLRNQLGADADDLSPRQRALLDNYEHTDEQGKKIIEATAFAAAKSPGLKPVRGRKAA
ncbi:helix-turn-helix domain-containing protein [Ottowia oryzae]